MKLIMKGLGIIIGVCLIFVSTTIPAETNYVSDTMKITMRTEPGKDRRIVALLSTGQKVEVLKPGNDWTLVQLPNGKKGYVLSRFLTKNIPSDIKLKLLGNKHDVLKAQSALLLEENNLLKEENNKLNTGLVNTQKEFQDLKKAYERLKKESADFLKLQSKYKKTTTELAEQTKKAEIFEDKLTKIIWNQNIKWFLSGAGVLILGFLIGLSTKRQRKRPSLM